MYYIITMNSNWVTLALACITKSTNANESAFAGNISSEGMGDTGYIDAIKLL